MCLRIIDLRGFAHAITEVNSKSLAELRMTPSAELVMEFKFEQSERIRKEREARTNGRV